MSEWKESAPIDYSPNGDDIDTFAQKTKGEFSAIYALLNLLRRSGAMAGLNDADTEAYCTRIDTTTGVIYMRDGENKNWIELGKVANYFGLTPNDIGAVKNGGGTGAVYFGNDARRNSSSITPATNDIYIASDAAKMYIYYGGAWHIHLSRDFKDMLNVEDYVVAKSEVDYNGPDKVLRLDHVTGKANVDIAGSPDKLLGKDIYCTKLHQNDVLMYDESSDQFINKPKDELLKADLTHLGEPEKIPVINPDGKITADITGSPDKILDIPIRAAMGIADDQVLAYDAYMNAFIPKDRDDEVTTIGGIPTDIKDIQNGNTIVYNSVDNKWVNADFGSAISRVEFDTDGDLMPLTTKGFVPKVDGQGSIGKDSKHWESGYINEMYVDSLKKKRSDGTYSEFEVLDMIGATASDDGEKGVVPIPRAGEQDKFLRGDGTWKKGICAVIKVQTIPNAVITCTGPAGTFYATADALTGIAVFDEDIDKLGDYTLTGEFNGRQSMNQPVVEVKSVTFYNATVSFFEATLTVTTEVGSEVTLTDGSEITRKTAVNTTVVFPVYNVGTAVVVASKNGVNSNTQGVTFSTNGEKKTAQLTFIKLTVKGVENESVVISKDSYVYTKVLGSNKQEVVYLPEVGMWSVVGTYIKNEQSVTKTKVANITAYGDYSVSVSGVVYAVYVDQNDIVESTCVHQVQGYDNYGFKPIKMNFTSNVENNTLDWGSWKDSFIMPKPCMLKHDGTVAYYLNPNDYTKKEDGSASDVSNTAFDGEAMMEWVPIFMKVVNDAATNRIYLYFSDNKEDNSYECYSALKSDGTYAEHFYTPIYEGSIINNKMRSLSTNAKPTANTTMDSERTAAKANGTGWDITCWADEDLLRCLGILVTGRLNSEVAIGNHCGEGSSLTHNCGSANKKGMFFGHSGTSAYATKYFGMENWWGHRWRRCTGLLVNNYKVYVKMTKHTRDGSKVADYSTSSVDGYIDTGVTVPGANASYIKTIAGAKNAVTVPTNVSGASATTGYCDGMWSNSGLRAPLCGGYVSRGSLCGLFALGVHDAASVSNWNIGASLSYKTL